MRGGRPFCKGWVARIMTPNDYYLTPQQEFFFLIIIDDPDIDNSPWQFNCRSYVAMQVATGVLIFGSSKQTRSAHVPIS